MVSVGTQGVRLPWGEVALHIRQEVASVLGSEVVAAYNQPGGFSPGTADRFWPWPLRSETGASKVRQSCWCT